MSWWWVAGWLLVRVSVQTTMKNLFFIFSTLKQSSMILCSILHFIYSFFFLIVFSSPMTVCLCAFLYTITSIQCSTIYCINLCTWNQIYILFSTKPKRMHIYGKSRKVKLPFVIHHFIQFIFRFGEAKRRMNMKRMCESRTKRK